MAQFPEKLYVAHRLDKEFSGAILFALKEATHKFLTQQFSEHTVDKTYIALTHGAIQSESSIIDKPLREFGSGRVGVDAERGKPSLTEFRVMERFGAYTLIKVHRRTGRRHQIRAHLYSIGHPLVGDLVRRQDGAKPVSARHATFAASHLPASVGRVGHS